MSLKSFGSDNQSGVHPEVLAAIATANHGHQPAYGQDAITRAAEQLFRDTFQCDLEVYFLWTGTAANSLAIRSVCRSYEAVVCTDIAHIHEDECGAPEWNSGSKLLPFPHVGGKLSPEIIAQLRLRPGDPHRVQPRLISLTQATEVGTCYSLAELQALSEAAHARGLLVHMDGARLANAAVFLGCDLRTLTVAAGIDLVSFGATKNGLLCGEALIFFDRRCAEAFPYYRKQAMQLASKMRFLACQFLPYLGDELWRRNAQQANAMALYLRQQLSRLPDAAFPYATEANEVFVTLQPTQARWMQQHAGVYEWDRNSGLLRFVTSFDTQRADIDRLLAEVPKAGTSSS